MSAHLENPEVVTGLKKVNLYPIPKKDSTKECSDHWTSALISHVIASLIAQLVKNLPAVQEIPVWFLGQEDPLEKGLTTLSNVLGPCGSAEKESTCNVGDLGSIPGLGRYPGEGKVYPLQYSGLENSMDYIVQGVAKSWTRVSEFHSLTHSHAIEVMLKILQTRLHYYENWEDSPESRGYQTS